MWFNREVVLGKLDAIFKDFVRKVSLKRNLPESIANEAGGKIFTFGSYRLGVHGKGMCRIVTQIVVGDIC
jgi:poly(A) polymerase